MSLAIFSLGNENLDIVSKILDSGIFDNAYIITGESGKNNFKHNNNCKVSNIILNANVPIEILEQHLESALKKKLSEDRITEIELAINISSGTGKMHAALIAAIMKLGYAFKLIELDKDGDVAAL